MMSNLQHKILLLCKIRPFIDTHTSILIYKSHLLSYLEYGSIFIDCLPLNLLQKLQRIQNKCLRICHHVDKTTSNVELHQKSKLLPLKQRRIAAICKFFFKKIRQSPYMLTEPVRKGNRSSFKRLIKLPIPKKNRFKSSLSYEGCKKWNSLPEQLRTNNDYLSFKRQLNKYMYDQFCGDGFV